MRGPIAAGTAATPRSAISAAFALNVARHSLPCQARLADTFERMAKVSRDFPLPLTSDRQSRDTATLKNLSDGLET